MPITLAQAKALSQDKFTNHVIDEFAHSAFIGELPFDNTVKPQGGKTLAYVYNRIKTQPVAGTRAVNGEYTAQETDTEQITANLKIMGGSYQIDRVIAEDETQLVNAVQFQSEQKAKATLAEFHNLTINGDTAADGTQFDGLKKLCAGTTTEIVPSSVLDLSTAASIKANGETLLYLLRRLNRNMKSGRPTHYLVNSAMYAVFQSVADFIPQIKLERSTLGDEVLSYGRAKFVDMGDKPGTTESVIGINADGTTEIYAVRVGMDGVHGVSPAGPGIVRTYLPNFKTAGAVKTGEVEMVAALVVKSTTAAGVITKLKVE